MHWYTPWVIRALKTVSLSQQRCAQCFGTFNWPFVSDRPRMSEWKHQDHVLGLVHRWTRADKLVSHEDCTTDDHHIYLYMMYDLV